MRRLFIGLLLLNLPVVFGFQATPAQDTNARVKSVFIYNFTRYIEWPADYKTGNFEITMLGTNQNMLNELNSMAAAKTVGTQKIEIKNITALSGLTGKNHILYVTPDNTTAVADIMKKISGTSTLLVMEKPGMAKQGAAINFVVVDNRQKFELNQANAEKNNLKVSSSLVALAIPVQ